MNTHFLVIDHTQFDKLKINSTAQISLKYARSFEVRENIAFIEISKPQARFTGRMAFCKISELQHESTTTKMGVITVDLYEFSTD